MRPHEEQPLSFNPCKQFASSLIDMQAGTILKKRAMKHPSMKKCCPSWLLLTLIIFTKTLLFCAWIIREYDHFDYTCAIAQSTQLLNMDELEETTRNTRTTRAIGDYRIRIARRNSNLFNQTFFDGFLSPILGPLEVSSDHAKVTRVEIKSRQKEAEDNELESELEQVELFQAPSPLPTTTTTSPTVKKKTKPRLKESGENRVGTAGRTRGVGRRQKTTSSVVTKTLATTERPTEATIVVEQVNNTDMKNISHSTDDSLSPIVVNMEEKELLEETTAEPQPTAAGGVSSHFEKQLESFTSQALCVSRFLLDLWCCMQCVTAFPFLLGVFCFRRVFLLLAHLVLDGLLLVVSFLYSMTATVFAVVLFFSFDAMSLRESGKWITFALLLDLVLLLYICLFVVTLRSSRLLLQPRRSSSVRRSQSGARYHYQQVSTGDPLQEA